MNYTIKEGMLEKLNQKGVEYWLYQKTLYPTEWLYQRIKQHIISSIKTHWNILALFSTKAPPYYLLYQGQFLINMKKILLSFQKQNQDYSLPFLIEFMKDKLDIDLSIRKNVYEKKWKKNMIYTLVDNKTFKERPFFRQWGTALLKNYAKIHKEIITWKKYGWYTEIIMKHIANELWYYQKKLKIWKN